jgi:hypothetical protein
MLISLASVYISLEDNKLGFRQAKAKIEGKNVAQSAIWGKKTKTPFEKNYTPLWHSRRSSMTAWMPRS